MYARWIVWYMVIYTCMLCDTYVRVIYGIRFARIYFARRTVYVCVCVYICMSCIYMYIYFCAIYMYITCVYICMYVYIHMYVCMYTHTHTYICLHIYLMSSNIGIHSIKHSQTDRQSTFTQTDKNSIRQTDRKGQTDRHIKRKTNVCRSQHRTRAHAHIHPHAHIHAHAHSQSEHQRSRLQGSHRAGWPRHKQRIYRQLTTSPPQSRSKTSRENFSDGFHGLLGARHPWAFKLCRWCASEPWGKVHFSALGWQW